jgi:hypothetical protein
MIVWVGPVIDLIQMRRESELDARSCGVLLEEWKREQPGMDCCSGVDYNGRALEGLVNVYASCWLEIRLKELL